MNLKGYFSGIGGCDAVHRYRFGYICGEVFTDGHPLKLLLMDSEGKIVNVVSEEYPLYFPIRDGLSRSRGDWYAQTMTGMHTNEPIDRTD